jgi:hypothetical protein
VAGAAAQHIGPTGAPEPKQDILGAAADLGDVFELAVAQAVVGHPCCDGSGVISIHAAETTVVDEPWCSRWLIRDAWLSRASKRRAQAWLAER